MATTTPASIIYTTVDGVVQTMLFDAVIAEDHATKAKVTKYPVQEGYHVSNHSIRENRVVSLKGSITNMKFDLGVDEPKTNYGSNSTLSVKQILDVLIQSGTECKVVTNLGVYDPVLFTSFKTGQKAGMVDSMEFTISGEEIVKIDSKNVSAPVPINFVEVTGAERDVLVEDLAAAEIYVSPCDKLSNGEYTVGEDFTLYDTDAAGTVTETTYIFIGIDPSDGSEMYEQHVSTGSVDVAGTGTTGVAETDPCAESGFDKSLLGGLQQIGGCLLAEATDIVTDVIEDKIETAMGGLVKSARGLLYDAVAFAGGPDSIGGMLMTAGTSCVVRGITGNTDAGSYNVGESLPTAAQIMDGASQGLGFTNPPNKVVSLTQIQCDCSDQTKPEFDATLFPRF